MGTRFPFGLAIIVWGHQTRSYLGFLTWAQLLLSGCLSLPGLCLLICCFSSAETSYKWGNRIVSRLGITRLWRMTLKAPPTGGSAIASVAGLRGVYSVVTAHFCSSPGVISVMKRLFSYKYQVEPCLSGPFPRTENCCEQSIKKLKFSQINHRWYKGKWGYFSWDLCYVHLLDEDFTVDPFEFQ